MLESNSGRRRAIPRGARGGEQTAGRDEQGEPGAGEAFGGAAHRPGRPRSAEAGAAILGAARDLLAEKGLSHMSIEEVAARAGVGKATVYRRWPSRGALALDAFLTEFQSQLTLPHTGTFREDLRAAVKSWVRAVTTTRAGRMLPALVAEAQRDPDLALAWRARVFNPLREQHRAIVDQAVRRGDLPPGTDADLVLDLVFGSAYHRLLHGHLPLDERFVTHAVDLVVDGLESGAGRRSPPHGPGKIGGNASRRAH